MRNRKRLLPIECQFSVLYENTRACFFSRSFVCSFVRSFIQSFRFDVGNTELKIYIVIECHKELKHIVRIVYSTLWSYINSVHYLVWCFIFGRFSFSSFSPVNNFRFSLCDSNKKSIALWFISHPLFPVFHFLTVLFWYRRKSRN